MACNYSNYGSGALPDSGRYSDGQGVYPKGQQNKVGLNILQFLRDWCDDNRVTHPREIVIGVGSAIFQESSWNPKAFIQATDEGGRKFCAAGIVQWTTAHGNEKDGESRQDKICDYINEKWGKNYRRSKYGHKGEGNALENMPLIHQLEALRYELDGTYKRVMEKLKENCGNMPYNNSRMVCASDTWTIWFEGLKSDKEKQYHSRHIEMVKKLYDDNFSN